MRNSLRLLAQVKPGRFLEANTPTGLTGLTTHPAPRPALILTYKQTLDKLQQLPASSVYRQSTEALTKNRLAIIEAAKPAGYDEWLSKMHKALEANPDAYKSMKRPDGSFAREKIYEDRSQVWDGEVTKNDALSTGDYTEKAATERGRVISKEVSERDGPDVPSVGDLDSEPPLDAEQINEIETKIGAGLIEEVLQVAEGELELVDDMLEAKVWEPLEEQPAEGQWRYHERPNPI